MLANPNDLSPDLLELQNAVRDFARREIEPIAHKLYLEGEEIPDDLVSKMQQMGVFGVPVSTGDGGLGLGALGAAIVTEELSRAWTSVGAFPLYNWSLILTLSKFGTAEQKKRWLPGLVSGDLQAAHAGTEPLAGSDAANIKTMAIRQGDRYVVSGSKLWCSNAGRADLLTVFCRTDRDQGRGGISMVVVEKPRGEQFAPPALTGHRIETIGFKGVHAYGLFFDDVVAPAENLIGGLEGQGFRQLMGVYEFARLHCAFSAIGLAQAAFDAAVEHSRNRVQFGRRIADFQAISHKLADMATQIAAARQLGYFAARRIDSGVRSDLEASMAKLFASEMMQKVCQEAVQIHGGMGLAIETPVNRYWRDAGLATIGDGTSEIQREIISRRILRD